MSALVGHAAILLLFSTASSENMQEEHHFEPDCSSENDFGWPRFHSSQDLIANEPWRMYFLIAYGELPQRYPVCIYDLEALNREAYEWAGLNSTTTGKHVVTNLKELKEGDLFMGGILGYQIYHERWKPIPNNTWVEITHSVFPTELKGMWVWRQRGSGIWYNIGRTLVFRTPADWKLIHRDAIEFLTANCSQKPSSSWPLMESDIFGYCAREKGYDSIQFEPQAGEIPIGTFGITGLTEIVLVNLDGKYTCGVSDASTTPLRSGWRASSKCDCENQDIPDSCGLMAKGPFPWNWIGTAPPLCKVQEGPPFWNRWKTCDVMSCKLSYCKHTYNRQAWQSSTSKDSSEENLDEKTSPNTQSIYL